MTDDIVEKILGYKSRMICGSKGRYGYNNPRNYTAFNSNVCTKEHGKIWHGDLDLTLDMDKLKDLSKKLGVEVFVLRESDAHFDNEDNPLFDRAICSVKNGEAKFHESEYLDIVDGIPFFKKVKPEKRQRVKPEKYNEEDYIKIKAISLARSYTKKRDTTPLYKYVLDIKDKVEKTGIKFDIAKCYYSAGDEKSLRALTRKWFKQVYKLSDGYSLQKNMMWHFFEYSLFAFQGKPKWFKDGYVYYKKPKE